MSLNIQREFTAKSKKILQKQLSDRPFGKKNQKTGRWQNCDLSHKQAVCLSMRTVPSIVTCKFSLLRCTLSNVNKNSTAPAAAEYWSSTPAAADMRCCRMHA